jgi:hypothetical protein
MWLKCEELDVLILHAKINEMHVYTASLEAKLKE